MHGIDEPLRLVRPDFKWQTAILHLIEKQPDDRTIYWFYDREGGAGKTTLMKWMVQYHGALPMNGKQSDMFHGILMHKEHTGMYPKIVIVDIPRSYLQYVSWSAIEKIKDGIFFSGKYDSGVALFNSPHVICFANEPPDTYTMSKDRWRVVDIMEGYTFDKDPDIGSSEFDRIMEEVNESLLADQKEVNETMKSGDEDAELALEELRLSSYPMKARKRLGSRSVSEIIIDNWKTPKDREKDLCKTIRKE